MEKYHRGAWSPSSVMLSFRRIGGKGKQTQASIIKTNPRRGARVPKMEY